ncbi:ribonucleoside triphosphate reductase [Candidatus Peregrinibacteria bacterium CG08_land_8_20_14_0_20_41_10]|nr:MAG: ribonucleoside triphosphate reductase [Candidatus Peregrinibacteria bacterium CG1_02_41_10]PIS32130.1 MAG: ribonucleoside triphosphate reductase [Candidatus Peregrinibacteria bacterium CG08_land_8_20_14_0_20_41_10]
MAPLKYLRKRDGRIVSFDENKVTEAVWKAVQATGEGEKKIAEKVSRHIVTVLEVLYRDNLIPTVEDIQDLVERILIEDGYTKTAKSYILYRDQHARMRTAGNIQMEVKKTMEDYLYQSDWRVNANANFGYSIGGLIINIAGKFTANYWLSNVYPPQIGEAHRSGDFYLHDLDMFSGYCAGWSLRQLLEEGFNGIPKKIESRPPKHLESALWQMINFLGTLQNEWAGAQAFSSFDTYLAPFVRKAIQEETTKLEEALSALEGQARTDFIQTKVYKRVHQAIQAFVFNMNTPTRWGMQTPFTNITLDWVCPEDMRNKKAIVGGQPQDYTYGELQKEMDVINKAFLEVMLSGDAKGRVFTFPIPTYNITRDFDWDHPNTQLLFEMTAKYGVPYFQNFINSPLKPSDVRSMCCRLQMDLRELRSRGGGLFGSAEMTGSIGVVTINMPRIGYLNMGNEEGYFQQLKKIMDLAKESLEIKRRIVQEQIDRGLLPATKRFLGSLNNHFSTIGLNGLNESALNFMGKNLGTPEGQAFAEKVLNFMRKTIQGYQAETGHLYNLEATPAEAASYKLAKEDAARFPGIIHAGTAESPYYTNSSQLPVNFTQDAFEALDLQNNLQTKYTGGTVLHVYLGEKVSSPEVCKKLVKRIAYNYRLPYFSITPTFSTCPKHGYLEGEHAYCPKCDEEIGYKSQLISVTSPVTVD